MRKRVIPMLAIASVVAMLFVPPIRQDLSYHHFADQRTILGIPSFWNVISNAPFLLVAVWGLRHAPALPSRRAGIRGSIWRQRRRCISIYGFAAILLLLSHRNCARIR